MKVLITGGSGLLGKYLIETSPNVKIYPTYYTNDVFHNSKLSQIEHAYRLDVTDSKQVDYLFQRVRPDIVIHTVSVGSVDYAERFPKVAYSIDVEGTKNVANACDIFKSKLVYISSNAVYGGNTPPYSEKSDQNPINRYGTIKREAEKIVKQLDNYFIFRFFLLYGFPFAGARQNWANIIAHKLLAKEEIRLVNDVLWQMTYAKDAAKAIWNIVLSENSKHKQYNIASYDIINLYEFGLKIAERLWQPTELIVPISSNQLEGLAPRPKNSTFDLTRMEEAGIEMMTVEEGLKDMYQK